KPAIGSRRALQARVRDSVRGAATRVRTALSRDARAQRYVRPYVLWKNLHESSRPVPRRVTSAGETPAHTCCRALLQALTARSTCIREGRPRTAALPREVGCSDVT